MSRSTSAPLERLTSASTSPVVKCVTLSISMLLYGSPQREIEMCSMRSISSSVRLPVCPQQFTGPRGVGVAQCRLGRDLVIQLSLESTEVVHVIDAGFQVDANLSYVGIERYNDCGDCVAHRKWPDAEYTRRRGSADQHVVVGDRRRRITKRRSNASA